MSPRPLAASRVLATRRTTVAAALAGSALLAAGLSGCDPDGPALPGTSPDPSAADPDAALLERARGEVEQVLALVTTLAARHRRMAPDLQPLVTLHTAHRDALAGDDTSAPSPGSTPAAPLAGDPAELWTLLLARERTLQRRLGQAAVEARSGGLARLLASMSAGIAAHVAAAPAGPGVA